MFGVKGLIEANIKTYFKARTKGRAICEIEVETIDEAIQQNWIPSFYEGDVEHGMACSSCAETMIDIGEDGEMELKAEYRGKVQYMDGIIQVGPKRKTW